MTNYEKTLEEVRSFLVSKGFLSCLLIHKDFRSYGILINKQYAKDALESYCRFLIEVIERERSREVDGAGPQETKMEKKQSYIG